MGGLSQLGIRIANAVLFVLCAFLTAGLVNEVGGALLTPTVVPAAVSTREQAARQPTWEDRRPILDRNLFGAQLAGNEPEVVEVVHEPVEDTKLPLRLLGTAACVGEADCSAAAIEDKGAGKHQVVRVGDRLERHTQVEVLAIEPKRVMLDNAGKREQLALDEDTVAAAPAPRGRESRSSSRSRPSNRLSDRLRELRGRAEKSDERKAGPRSPANLFSQARVLPKYEDGEMVGIQLSAIKADSLFERFGLKNGDVITELNGIEISNPSASAKILAELAQADQFEFVVNGEQRSIPADEVSSILDQL